MTQSDIGDIDPDNTTGTELADSLLEPWRDALHSQHKGSSRPSYAVAGTYWIDDSSTPWQLKLYDGSQDIIIATYDPSNHHVDTIRADVISESSSGVGVTIDNVLIKDGSVGSSGSRVTKVWTTELDVDGQFVLGPEHATDSGTDTYDSDTTTTPPDDGDRITRDFQSANTTTTPTLDSKTITDRDGNALWAGAINGVHEFQYASGTDTYLLLDPRPIDEDDMASDSDAAVPTQQSVAAFVGCEKIESGTVSSASSLDITDLSADYRAYLIVFDDLVATTLGANLYLRTDTDNGASFDSGSSDYVHQRHGANGGTAFAIGDTSADQVELSGNVVGDSATEALAGWIMVHNPMGASSRTRVTCQLGGFSSSGTGLVVNSSGGRRHAEANDAVQLLISSGNITSMNYTLYGYR